MIRAQFSLDLNSELIVDNFAGGGGASTGIELALGRHVDIAINHDPEAVLLHETNHPQTKHYCEDVFTVDPAKATGGRPVGLAWFSPDCKHFSKAKGGKPRSKKIRGLAWVMVKWADLVRPRVMILENVEEFKTWGPLLEDGSPRKDRKGKTYRSFVARLRNLGYTIEDKELRACDYGAPTIRKRLFLIARCDGKPIVWPEPTHGAPGSEGVRSGRLKPWRTAAECIDWSIPTKSIFNRERPLAEATMRRIARGLQKFVIDAAEPFIVKVNHTGYDQFRGQAFSEPFQTVTGKNGWGVAVPFVTEHANASGQRNFAADEPLRTQCSEVKGGHFAVVAPTIVNSANSKTTGRGPNTWTAEEPTRTITSAPGFGLVGATLIGAGGPTYSGKPKSVEEPFNTMTTENHSAVVSAFLAKHYTDQGQRPGSSMEEPVSTVTTADHNAVVAASLIRHFGESVGQPADNPAPTVMSDGAGKTGLITANLAVQTTGHPGGSAEDPLKTIATGGHHSLVTSHLAKMYGTTTGQRTDGPMHTVTSGGNHIAEVRAFLIKYYGNEKEGIDIEEPMHTVTTKDRVGLVTVAGEEYVISDIGMRMLEPHELYAAQGFPPSYIIAPIVNGRRLPKHAQVRMCGNSVCPPLATALVAANVPELSAWEKGDRRAA